MNDNWPTYLREMAILLGDMPPPVLLRRTTYQFEQPTAHLLPLPRLDREQPVARVRAPGIDRDRS